MTTLTTPTLSPREATPHSTRVNSWWVAGSRDRYGTAYFLSQQTTLTRGGAERLSTVVWENRRPYGINEKVGVIEKPYWLVTWDDLDATIHG